MPKKNPDDEKREQLEEAAAAAMKEAMESAETPGKSLQKPIIWHNPELEIVTRNHNPPGGSLNSPYMFQLNTLAVRALLKVARQRKIEDAQVQKVMAARVPLEDLVYIAPTGANDENGIPVFYRKGQAWFNLRTLLAPIHYMAPVNYRIRYAVKSVEESPVGPALMVEMARPIDRRLQPASKRAGRKNPAPPSNLPLPPETE